MTTRTLTYAEAYSHLQERLQKLRDDAFEKFIKNRQMPEDHLKATIQLKEIGDKRAKLAAQYHDDLNRIEQQRKYWREITELRQGQIISGRDKPSIAELAGFEKYIEGIVDSPDFTTGYKSKVDTRLSEIKEIKEKKVIPGFWLRVLENCNDLKDLIKDYDKPILAHLINLRVEKLEYAGYKLVFEFEENDYIEDRVLEKHILMSSKKSTSCIRVSQALIKWKPAAPEGVEDGFFRLFKRSIIPEPKPKTKVTIPAPQEGEPMEQVTEEPTPKQVQEEREKVQQALDEDAKIANIIRDKILPVAIYYYFGLVADKS